MRHSVSNIINKRELKMNFSKKLFCICLVIATLSSFFIPAAAVKKPAAVKGFECTSLGAHSLVLSWQKVAGAEGYIIYRAPITSDSYQRVAVGKFDGSCTLKKGLTANTKYKFAIRAYNQSAEGKILSDKYPVIRLQTLPAPVSKLSVAVSEQRLLLQWAPSAGADGYRVFYSENNGKSWKFYFDTEKTANRRKDLDSGKVYVFGVHTYRFFSGKKFVSRERVTVKDVTKPSTPEFEHTRIDREHFKMTFRLVNGATGYVIYTQLPGQKWKRQNVTVTDRSDTKRTVAFTIKNAPQKVYLTVKAIKKVGKTTYCGDFRKKLSSTVAPKGSIVSYGDSIAKGTGSHYWTYSDLFADQFNYTTADHKYTLSGASIAYNRDKEHSDDMRLFEAVASSIKKGDSYTYIFLEGGRNDYYFNVPVGKVTANGTKKFNNYTVCGALETTLYHLKVNTWKTRVIFVLVHDCDNASQKKNALGFTFTQYANAIKTVCKKYGVGVADVFGQTNFKTANKAIANQYTFHYFGVFPDGDGVHPSEYAYQKFYLPQIINAAKGLKPI